METWDIYDVRRRPTGRTMLRGEAVQAGDYHLVVHVVFFNRAGQMLIQQRQSCKRSWPEYWDISVGGCAIQGESSQQAAMREVREELGLLVDLSAAAPDLTLSFPGGFDDINKIERLCDQYQIPFATNAATAEVLVQGLRRGDLDWRNIVNPKRR